MLVALFCFCKQTTASEMRISDWSSDVCSSDLCAQTIRQPGQLLFAKGLEHAGGVAVDGVVEPEVIEDRIPVVEHFVTRAVPRTGPVDQFLVQVHESGRTSGRDRVCQYV